METEHSMLKENLMEVRGPVSELGARLYAERVSGRIVERTTHLGANVYQVELR